MTKFKLTILILLITAFGVVVSGCVKKPVQPNVNQNVNTATTTRTMDDIKAELTPSFDDPAIISFNVSRYIDNYASGNAGVKDSSGFAWIAKKNQNNGSWSIIFRGQEYASCSLLEDNKVPFYIYSGYCFTDDGKSLSIYGKDK